MKKAILIGLLALISGFGLAQRHIYFQEGFIYEGGGRYSIHQELWDQSDLSGLEAMYFANTREAGGEAPEALWGYLPDNGLSDKLNGTYRLVFKKYKTFSNHNNYASVRYYYESDRNSAMDVRVFGLAARKAGGAWQVCRQINTMTKNLGKGRLVAELPEDMRNAFEIQVCVFYTTPADNANYLLYVDDIEFFAYPDNDYAVNLTWADEPFTATGRLNIGLAVENTGNRMEDCEISYTLDGGAVHTLPLTFTGGQMPNGLMPDETYVSYFSPEGWDETAYGKHTVEFWLSKANGTAIAEDKIQKQVKYLMNLDPATHQPYPFRPVVEHFSASTCGPCAALNKLMNPFYENAGDTLSVIKYQMDWPGDGDPYSTEEGVERRVHYDVGSVPTVVLDGSTLSFDVNTYTDLAAAMQKAMSAAATKQVYFGMWFDTVAVDAEQNIRVSLKVKAPYFVENVILHTVVEEGTTYGNVGSNGETEFHNVMMKMLPDANGVKLDLKPDTVYTFTYAYDMTQTHMEEFTDLRVVCFLQTESGNVLQSVMGKAGSYGTGAGVSLRADYVPAYICAEDVPAGLRLICTGAEPVTAIEIEGKVGATGTPVLQTYTIPMEWGEDAYVVFDDLKAPAATGADTVFFTVTKLNGEAFDGQPLRCPVYVQPTQNAFLPALEGFTSSANRGSGTLNPYLDAIEGVCTAKYPMKNDRYTRTVYTRYAAKLGIDGAPGLALNGKRVRVESEGTLTDGDYFEDLLAKVQRNHSILKVNLEGNAVISGSGTTPSVRANFNFESPVDASLRLYALVVETEVQSTGNNIGKQSKRVVQALFPDENGASVRVRDGKGIYVLTRSILSSTVENYGNLKLVIIIKDADNSEVLQTAEFPLENQVPNEGVMAYETLEVYPNPASECVYLKALDNATVDVFDVTGVRVFGLNGVNGDYTLDVRGYVPGAYIIKVREGAKVSTARISVVR